MKIKGGYYIKARCIQNSFISVAPPHVREIWDWLLKEANHKDKKYSIHFVKRGQLFRTYKDIREGLHWMVGYRKMMYSENQTKRAMKTLREQLMIITTKALGGVLITIINYDKYQDPKNYESTNESTNESTKPEPMKYQGIPHNNKNDKNEKNDNKYIAETSSAEIIPNLLNDNNLHIKIIGLYARLKNINFNNAEQQRSFIKRNLRASLNLKAYPIERIIETMKWLKENADFDWKLETVGKYIDEINLVV